MTARGDMGCGVVLMTDGTVIAIANTALSTLSFPTATALDSLYVVQNPALAALSFPDLSSIGTSFVATSNAALPTCEAQALALQANPASTTISGNDDAATCP